METNNQGVFTRIDLLRDQYRRRNTVVIGDLVIDFVSREWSILLHDKS